MPAFRKTAPVTQIPVHTGVVRHEAHTLSRYVVRDVFQKTLPRRSSRVRLPFLQPPSPKTILFIRRNGCCVPAHRAASTLVARRRIQGKVDWESGLSHSSMAWPSGRRTVAAVRLRMYNMASYPLGISVSEAHTELLHNGAVAQLGERFLRTEEVGSSNLLSSTILQVRLPSACGPAACAAGSFRIPACPTRRLPRNDTELR